MDRKVPFLRVALEAVGALLYYAGAIGMWLARPTWKAARFVASRARLAVRDMVSFYGEVISANAAAFRTASLSVLLVIGAVFAATAHRPPDALPVSVTAEASNPSFTSTTQNVVFASSKRQIEASQATVEPPTEPAEDSVLVSATELEVSGGHDFVYVPNSLARASANAVSVIGDRYGARFPNCNITSEFLIATAWLESRPWWSRLQSSGEMVPPLDNKWGAQGPFQFTAETWDIWGFDGNGDGLKDPQNVFDAAVASARYQCDLALAYDGDVSNRDTALEVAIDYHDGPNRDRDISDRCLAGEELQGRLCSGEQYAEDRASAVDALLLDAQLRDAGVWEVKDENAAGTSPYATAVEPGPCSVFILGDSLTVGAAPFFSDAFGLLGMPAPQVSAAVGRSLSEASDVLADVSTEAGILIVALGTNDFYRSKEAVSEYVDSIGAAWSGPTVWVGPSFEDALWVNDLLDSPVKDPSFERHVADDGIHLTTEGYRNRAAFVAETVNATCS